MLANKVHSTILGKSLPAGYGFVFDPRKSKGSIIHDSLTNQKFIDMFSFYGSCPIGHNHPEMKKFAKELGRMAIHNPANSDVYTAEYAKFVESFGKWFPPGFDKLFFISGGALAIENACKAAFDWKMRMNAKQGLFTHENKLQIIHFTGAFHGRSGYTMSMTNTDYWKTAYFPKFNWFRADFPNTVSYPGRDASILGSIRRRIGNNHSNTAAILVEPIQGEGGDNHMRPQFWQGLRQIANDTQVMLIADEVQCGMGITGRRWAWEWLGAEPDMIVFGKKSQVCGFASNRRIDLVDDNVFKMRGRINSTWGGNLVDMMRARKYLEIIENEDLLTNALDVGRYTLNLIKSLCERHPNLIGRPRGRGLMIAFDLIKEDTCEKFKNDMYKAGVIVISAGTNTIRLRPMLDVDKRTIDKVIKTMDNVLGSL